MGTREFPVLGFDPAPGDPGAVAAAARSVDRAGRVFADASGNVSRLNSSGWTGQAADAFRSQLKDLPRDLDLAARSHHTAARTLADYAGGLQTRQARAADLEARAAELRQLQAAAVVEVNRIAAQTAPAGSPELAALQGQYTSARARADAISGDLAQVIADARRLHGEHQTAAQSAGSSIRNASDAPYKEPGWLSRAWDSVKNWIKDNADVLRTISTVLKGVSAVLGVLSFVPGLQFLAPFAIGAGVAALLIDGALCAAGEGNWTALALDAALTMLPIGPVARAVNRIPGVSSAFKAANRAIPDTVKGPLFRAVGNLPEGVTRAQLDDAARLIRSKVGDVGDDVIVQGSRAGYSARPDSDIDFGVRVRPDRFEEIVSQRFNNPNPGSAKDRTMREALERGRLHGGEAGFRQLRSSLEEVLGRKVDISVIKRGGLFDAEPWLRAP